MKEEEEKIDWKSSFGIYNLEFLWTPWHNLILLFFSSNFIDDDTQNMSTNIQLRDLSKNKPTTNTIDLPIKCSSLVLGSHSKYHIQ